MEYELEIYSNERGREPFRDWLDKLGDHNTRALIFQKLQRIRLGNFGDCKSLGDGLFEFRIHTKGGLRIYYSLVGKKVVLILGGGDKASQRNDIEKSKRCLIDYKKRFR